MKNDYPKAVYDKKSDSLYLIVAEGSDEGFIELAPNINLEVGQRGKIIGIEILNASKVLGRAKRPLQLIRAR